METIGFYKPIVLTRSLADMTDDHRRLAEDLLTNRR